MIASGVLQAELERKFETGGKVFAKEKTIDTASLHDLRYSYIYETACACAVSARAILGSKQAVSDHVPGFIY